ncbi:biotin-dependent carboxyltransferase family protein [Sulfitobacter donghicola]|uniref:Urea amidolyase n=1 Tax=Sulfitobacter donghicola DSW-25 = KCTC 12864 = JCM 14565 TaxID=1300350 RepID=A0A073IFF7_9RHOB|nr:biotin-dependent carboxyltransferase family protein [Sulfitobacter donghicola]KEJ89058.1 urea amidolyase [Sulfitobacter donghicola DSW-25 = KCTC 12864 = JCM 14565]KIN67371.1 Allophanate hydrolase subunit 2 [Sulfitobacter donghicola DSW-25 = KCTC 12864 = JCM 14565]
MNAKLSILRAGPSMTLQDMGRAGHLALGLSRGGAADRLALAEGAALLGQPANTLALEMAALGGEFQASEDTRIALTGAPMRVTIDGEAVVWNASHWLPAGARLSIGAATAGCYGYLHVGGGFVAEPFLGAASAHLSAGIGALIQDGEDLAIGTDAGCETNRMIEPEDRFHGGAVRLTHSFQTHLFEKATLDRLQSEPLRRAARANRMGVALTPQGGGYHIEGGRNVVSEIVLPGDIQVTGDGMPFVLMVECQTTGGYPRIGTVLPCDLPRVAQAPAGAELQFRFIEIDEAIELERAEAKRRVELDKSCRPLIRDPRLMRDLLSYNLIDGVVAGNESLRK